MKKPGSPGFFVSIPVTDMKLNYLDLYTTDAAWNLAAEQYVFDALPRDRSYFMLWQNKNAVIVGKYQNTAAELNAAYIKEQGVQVVRRLSGGGAVYHDLGNLNFSFITDAGAMEKLDLSLFCRPVIRTLQKLGVPAELNGRNDMTVDGKKFSGNSQYRRQGRVLHHGTLLFSSDLEAVTRALHVDAEKLSGKGVSSVRSRVANLRDYLPPEIELPEFRALLLREMLSEAPGEEYRFSDEDLRSIESIREERYARWDWNYGLSPAAQIEKKRRVEGCGSVSVFLTTEGGRISALVFRGDFFSSREPERLSEKLIGVPLREDALSPALNGVDVGLYLQGMSREALIQILLD